MGGGKYAGRNEKVPPKEFLRRLMETESPKEFLRRLMETFRLNNRYNKQFQSDSGRASPMEVFINGLPEYLSKVGKDKMLTLPTDAPEEHKLSVVAIAVDTPTYSMRRTPRLPGKQP